MANYAKNQAKSLTEALMGNQAAFGSLPSQAQGVTQALNDRLAGVNQVYNQKASHGFFAEHPYAAPLALAIGGALLGNKVAGGTGALALGAMAPLIGMQYEQNRQNSLTSALANARKATIDQYKDYNEAVIKPTAESSYFNATHPNATKAPIGLSPESARQASEGADSAKALPQLMELIDQARSSSSQMPSRFDNSTPVGRAMENMATIKDGKPMLETSISANGLPPALAGIDITSLPPSLATALLNQYGQAGDTGLTQGLERYKYDTTGKAKDEAQTAKDTAEAGFISGAKTADTKAHASALNRGPGIGSYPPNAPQPNEWTIKKGLFSTQELKVLEAAPVLNDTMKQFLIPDDKGHLRAPKPGEQGYEGYTNTKTILSNMVGTIGKKNGIPGKSSSGGLGSGKLSTGRKVVY